MSGRDERSGQADRPGRGDRRPSWRDDRVWQAGFLLGSALGAAATVAGRHAEKAARRGSGKPLKKDKKVRNLVIY